MQVLEKILEEIEKGTHTFELLGRDVDFVAIDWVRDVIRKYMNDDNEIMKQCPYCENEAALHWDVEKDGHQVFCPNCGKPMMLCSMCDAKDGAVCDWKEGEGCKHSDERYRDYFRKHMNDGWISVDDKLPEDDVDVLITYADMDDENYTDICITTYGYAYLGGNKLDFKGWRSPFEYFKTNYKIMAWRPLPEAYLPEWKGINASAKKRYKSQITKEIILEMQSQGKSIQEIAKELQCGVNTIRRRLGMKA